MTAGSPAHSIRCIAYSHPLTERPLVAAAQAGDERARVELLEAFTPSIGAIARRYYVSGVIDRAELMQEGAVGLLRALERYDPERGTPFWAYASWWVRQAMQCLVSELTHPVVLSDRAVRKLARVKDAQRHHLQAHRRSASPRELAEATGLVREQVERLQAIDRAPHSLAELEFDELPDPLGEDPDQDVIRRDTIRAVRALGTLLDEREREILRARYGFEGEPEALRQIAQRLGISAERVRQIESGALDKLRAFVESDEGDRHLTTNWL